MDTDRQSLSEVSVSFRNCLPCENAVAALRTMALDAAARQLVAQVRAYGGLLELKVRLGDGLRTGTWRVEATSLPAALERMRQKVEAWRHASGPIRTDRSVLREAALGGRSPGVASAQPHHLVR